MAAHVAILSQDIVPASLVNRKGDFGDFALDVTGECKHPRAAINGNLPKPLSSLHFLPLDQIIGTQTTNNQPKWSLSQDSTPPTTSPSTPSRRRGSWRESDFYRLLTPSRWRALTHSIAPHFYAIALFNKERAPGTAEWDGCNPAKNIQNVKDAKLSPAMAERFQRAEGAQNNGFITLGFFAAAIVSGPRMRWCRPLLECLRRECGHVVRSKLIPGCR